ncbi:MAG: ATP-binding protein, partial [Calditrichaeota bacterium]
GVPFLGEIPITPELRTGGDNGKPIVLEHPDSIAAKAFFHIAEEIVKQMPEAPVAMPKHFKL